MGRTQLRDESVTECTRSGRVLTHLLSFIGKQVEHGFLARAHTHRLQTALRPLQEQHGITKSQEPRRDGKRVRNHRKNHKDVTSQSSLPTQITRLLLLLLLLLLLSHTTTHTVTYTQYMTKTQSDTHKHKNKTTQNTASQSHRNHEGMGNE